MNSEDVATKLRLKTWGELAPFYLDYAEALQANFLVNDLQWVRAPDTPNGDGYFELELLISGQLEQNSFIAPLTVLYPDEATEIAPDELVRSDRELTSPEPQQDPVRPPGRQQVLPAV